MGPVTAARAGLRPVRGVPVARSRFLQREAGRAPPLGSSPGLGAVGVEEAGGPRPLPTGVPARGPPARPRGRTQAPPEGVQRAEGPLAEAPASAGWTAGRRRRLWAPVARWAVFGCSCCCRNLRGNEVLRSTARRLAGASQRWRGPSRRQGPASVCFCWVRGAKAEKTSFGPSWLELVSVTSPQKCPLRHTAAPVSLWAGSVPGKSSGWASEPSSALQSLWGPCSLPPPTHSLQPFQRLLSAKTRFVCCLHHTPSTQASCH